MGQGGGEGGMKTNKIAGMRYPSLLLSLFVFLSVSYSSWAQVLVCAGLQLLVYEALSYQSIRP